ncbi:hypothetical protein EDEG_04215, partial [Edhazardia aedis USNM 41457]
NVNINPTINQNHVDYADFEKNSLTSVSKNVFKAADANEQASNYISNTKGNLCANISINEAIGDLNPSFFSFIQENNRSKYNIDDKKYQNCLLTGNLNEVFPLQSLKRNSGNDRSEFIQDKKEKQKQVNDKHLQIESSKDKVFSTLKNQALYNSEEGNKVYGDLNIKEDTQIYENVAKETVEKFSDVGLCG